MSPATPLPPTRPATDSRANANGFQTVIELPAGTRQFFASKINTSGSGSLSMLYSTYFGGGNPAGATASRRWHCRGSYHEQSPNMYITGTTNMLPHGWTRTAKHSFPLFNAQQSCLNEASNHGNLHRRQRDTNTDAFVAKINPNQARLAIPSTPPIWAASGNDIGHRHRRGHLRQRLRHRLDQLD